MFRKANENGKKDVAEGIRATAELLDPGFKLEEKPADFSGVYAPVDLSDDDLLAELDGSADRR